MARRVADVLADAGAQPVVLQGGPRSTGEALGLSVLDDEWPGEGPLAALATATAWAAAGGAELVVVAACDQPALTSPVVRTMVDALVGAVTPGRGVGGSVAITPDGRRHPFPSVWATRIAPTLRSKVERGERRADGAWSEGVIEVAVTPGVLVDLDTPEDLLAHRAARHAAGGTGPGPTAAPDQRFP